MSAQEKYQSLLELANQNGTTYELTEGEGGALIVTGTAPSAEAKARASDIAKSVSGVASVDNQLEVRAM